ncbi:MAG: hypothetical protein ACXWT7_06325 [Methylophilaceae bacterium]
MSIITVNASVAVVESLQAQALHGDAEKRYGFALSQGGKYVR